MVLENSISKQNFKVVTDLLIKLGFKKEKETRPLSLHNVGVGVASLVGASTLQPTDPIYGAPFREGIEAVVKKV